MATVNNLIPSEDVRLLGLSLCWLQIFDGLLTSIGLHRYGISFEGNPLLHSFMLKYGFETTLFYSKLLGIMMIIFVCCFATHKLWIKHSLIIINLFYLFIAVIPWIITLA